MAMEMEVDDGENIRKWGITVEVENDGGKLKISECEGTKRLIEIRTLQLNKAYEMVEYLELSESKYKYLYNDILNGQILPSWNEIKKFRMKKKKQKLDSILVIVDKNGKSVGILCSSVDSCKQLCFQDSEFFCDLFVRSFHVGNFYCEEKKELKELLQIQRRELRGEEGSTIYKLDLERRKAKSEKERMNIERKINKELEWKKTMYRKLDNHMKSQKHFVSKNNQKEYDDYFKLKKEDVENRTQLFDFDPSHFVGVEYVKKDNSFHLYTAFKVGPDGHQFHKGGFSMVVKSEIQMGIKSLYSSWSNRLKNFELCSLLLSVETKENIELLLKSFSDDLIILEESEIRGFLEHPDRIVLKDGKGTTFYDFLLQNFEIPLYKQKLLKNGVNVFVHPTIAVGGDMSFLTKSNKTCSEMFGIVDDRVEKSRFDDIINESKYLSPLEIFYNCSTYCPHLMRSSSPSLYSFCTNVGPLRRVPCLTMHGHDRLENGMMNHQARMCTLDNIGMKEKYLSLFESEKIKKFNRNNKTFTLRRCELKKFRKKKKDFALQFQEMLKKKLRKFKRNLRKERMKKPRKESTKNKQKANIEKLNAKIQNCNDILQYEKEIQEPMRKLFEDLAKSDKVRSLKEYKAHSKEWIVKEFFDQGQLLMLLRDLGVLKRNMGNFLISKNIPSLPHYFSYLVIGFVFHIIYWRNIEMFNQHVEEFVGKILNLAYKFYSFGGQNPSKFYDKKMKTTDGKEVTHTRTIHTLASAMMNFESRKKKIKNDKKRRRIFT